MDRGEKPQWQLYWIGSVGSVYTIMTSTSASVKVPRGSMYFARPKPVAVLLHSQVQTPVLIKSFRLQALAVVTGRCQDIGG